MTRKTAAGRGEPCFLSGARLSAAIRRIAAGREARFAVAFWGKGAQGLYGVAGLPDDARIICDVSLGGTNPAALIELGGPGDQRLRCLDGLHAKVYLSDLGMIACSANASGGGVGFDKPASLSEAGVLHSPDSAAFAEAGRWFERLWRRSRQVDENAIALARSRWRPTPGRAAGGGALRNPLSLLDAVVANPARFRGVGFALSTGTSTVDHRNATATAVIAEDNARAAPLLTRREHSAIRQWPVHDVFSEWSVTDIDAWPRRFICAHRGGRGGLSYWFYERVHVAIIDGTDGMVLARKQGALRRALGLAHGTVAMATADASRLHALHDHLGDEGHRLLETPEKLVTLLTQLDLVS
jgi:hypothetical protein